MHYVYLYAENIQIKDISNPDIACCHSYIEKYTLNNL